MVTRHRFVTALAEAVHAPSIHNSQPWRLRLGHDDVELILDADVTPRLVDPIGRAALASMGAFAANVELLLEHHLQRATSITWLPEGAAVAGGPGAGGQEYHGVAVALVRLLGERIPADGDRVRRLVGAIPRRRTTRLPLLGGPPTPQQWDALTGFVPGTSLTPEAAAVQADAPLRAALLEITVEADAGREADPAYLAELQRWVGRHDDTGVPRTSVGVVDEARRYPGRDFTQTLDGDSSPTYARYEPDPALLVLHGPDDSPRTWLEAGRATQRVMLEATALGLGVGVLGQALEEASWRGRVDDVVSRSLGKDVVVHQLLRLGQTLAEPVARTTPRRSLPELLLHGA